MSDNVITSIFLIFTLTCSLFGQSTSKNNENQVEQVISLYENLKYEEALDRGRTLLQNRELNPDAMLTLNTYLGVIWYSLGKSDSARSYFLSALSIKPDLTLSELKFSPKIIHFFENIKKEYSGIRKSSSEIAFKEYIFIQDLRPGAGWRSALIPGWGQIYKGQKTRGLLIGSAFAAGIISTLFSYTQESRYHDKYLESIVQKEIDDNYQTYNQWYKTRRSLLVFTGIVWTLGIADALWSPYNSSFRMDSSKNTALITFSIPLY